MGICKLICLKNVEIPKKGSSAGLGLAEIFKCLSIVPDTLDRGLLKPGNWIPIFLTVVVCGTFACSVIAVFIIYRFIVEDVLDGNPALTIVLILANVFTLQTVLPFCMNDEYLEAESLNSWKILLTTLAFGLDLSIMLSRAFFLLFSKGGVFTAHINGYLQGLMVFFMFCVQLAISIMFFVLSTDESAVVARSLIFILLLGKLRIFLYTSSLLYLLSLLRPEYLLLRPVGIDSQLSNIQQVFSKVSVS